MFGIRDRGDGFKQGSHALRKHLDVFMLPEAKGLCEKILGGIS